MFLLCPPVYEHGVDLVPVPGDHLGPLPQVVHHQLGPAVHEGLLQHHLEESHGARVDQADPEAVSHQPSQAVHRTLNTGDGVAGLQVGLAAVPTQTRLASASDGEKRSKNGNDLIGLISYPRSC